LPCSAKITTLITRRTVFFIFTVLALDPDAQFFTTTQRTRGKMKIACVLGSPRRKGNSAIIANHLLAAAEKRGAECKSFFLNGLRYYGCQACYSCKKKSEKCVVKDDLAEVLDAVREADVLVVATGTYFGEITGQLKTFIDRTFSFLKPDFHENPQPSRLEPGKKLVFIIAQAQANEKLFADVYPRYERFFKLYGYADRHLIRVCGTSPDVEIMDRPEVVKSIDETVFKVMGEGGSI
jgi:multimeric flavodoxin WrbA